MIRKFQIDFWIFFFFFVEVNFALSGHKCIHDDFIVPQVKVHKVHGIQTYSMTLDKEELSKRGSVFMPLRLKINYDMLYNDPGYLCTAVGQVRQNGLPASPSTTCPVDENDCAGGVCNDCWFTCTEKDVLTTQKLNFIVDKIVPDIQNHYSNALSVDRVQSLKLNGNWCNCSSSYGSPIPAQYQTGVSNEDMVIFLSGRTTRYRGNTIAFACACAIDAVTHRPIAGYINWGPNEIDLSADNYPEQLGVGVHEVTHALGFSNSLYGYYQNGDPTKNTVLTEPGFSAHSVKLLASPRVAQEAQQHFNCPTLQGVELENGGSSGTAGSHWERRVLMYEYMNGYSSYDPVYSRFTLALFEDTGWYQANFSSAKEFYFGKGKGCSFVQQRCNHWTSPYNCNALEMGNDESCLFDGRKKAKCNIVSYSSPGITDPWYVYYGDATVAGSDDFADYCGLYQYDSSYFGDCTYAPYGDSSVVSNFQFSQVNQYEHYGSNSRCVTAVDGSEVSGPSCQEFSCVDGKLMMKVGEVWYDCSVPGSQIKTTEGFDGYYLCPSAEFSWCNEVVNYQSTQWPQFVSVTPSKGAVGDTVTIVAQNFGTSPRVTFGEYHGCNGASMTINGTTITCKIGVKGEKVLWVDEVVDLTVSDSLGRGDTKIKGFTLLSSASKPTISILLVFLILFALLK